MTGGNCGGPPAVVLEALGLLQIESSCYSIHTTCLASTTRQPLTGMQMVLPFDIPGVVPAARMTKMMEMIGFVVAAE